MFSNPVYLAQRRDAGCSRRLDTGEPVSLIESSLDGQFPLGCPASVAARVLRLPEASISADSQWIGGSDELVSLATEELRTLASECECIVDSCLVDTPLLNTGLGSGDKFVSEKVISRVKELTDLEIRSQRPIIRPTSVVSAVRKSFFNVPDSLVYRLISKTPGFLSENGILYEEDALAAAVTDVEQRIDLDDCAVLSELELFAVKNNSRFVLDGNIATTQAVLDSLSAETVVQCPFELACLLKGDFIDGYLVNTDNIDISDLIQRIIDDVTPTADLKALIGGCFEFPENVQAFVAKALLPTIQSHSIIKRALVSESADDAVSYSAMVTRIEDWCADEETELKIDTVVDVEAFEEGLLCLAVAAKQYGRRDVGSLVVSYLGDALLLNAALVLCPELLQEPAFLALLPVSLRRASKMPSALCEPVSHTNGETRRALAACDNAVMRALLSASTLHELNTAFCCTDARLSGLPVVPAPKPKQVKAVVASSAEDVAGGTVGYIGGLSLFKRLLNPLYCPKTLRPWLPSLPDLEPLKSMQSMCRGAEADDFSL